ncbi:class II peroxidase [Sphaerobolus stellatus SS14]|uniref:Peroxidase n=1 Tax=Sphaerobolus stellatus (strain SS14) TaxID=990650 RepID=A0A0C9U863_SPHS4|nr:class II peroxidase [Sphaerobolus stellatus SS14]
MPSKSLLLISFVTLAVSVNAASITPKRATCPDGATTTKNAACCSFFALAEDLQKKIFLNECGEDAHEALRFSFHEAITFSKVLAAQGKFPGGGADGSFLIFLDVEANFLPANAGLSDSVDFLLPVLGRHPDITAGYFVQFAGAVAVGNCPRAPRLQFMAGRLKVTAPGPQGLIPLPEDSVDNTERTTSTPLSPPLLSIATFSHLIPNSSLRHFSRELASPGTANSTSEAASPLPLTSGDESGELRLQSDFALARDPRTACTWQNFVNQKQAMTNAFANAMLKLSVVGVGASKHIDCSEAMPVPAAPNGKGASYPATKSFKDVQQACKAPFPSLPTNLGATETVIPHCPAGATDCDS